MAAVTANQLITAREPGSLRPIPVTTLKRLYQGTLVYIDANGFATDDDAAGVNEFAGVVKKEADNSAGLDGAIKVEVFTKGSFLLVGTGFTQANSNYQLVYGSDNYTITVTAAGSSKIGRVTEFVSSTQVYVDIDPIQA